MSVRIALIHATPVAMPPVIEAFQRGWPEADTMNLLDDSLSADLARVGRIDEIMMQRFAMLADYASSTGTDGILFTCSAFAEAIEATARQAQIPVLKPNEAMFAEALASGHSVGLLATFEPSIPSMEQEFVQMAATCNKAVHVETVWVPEAMQALASGDAARHDALIAAAASRLAHCDVVMLAQFSMARALPVVRQAVRNPVLTSPDSAVAKLKILLQA